MGEQEAAGLQFISPKGLINEGLQLSRLERTPDKREVGGSSPLKPTESFKIQ